MIISEKKINIGLNLFFSGLISIIYFCLKFTGYYDFDLRLMAVIGLIPVFSAVLIFLKIKDIRIAVITLVLYQTWNMFLEPYTWSKPIKSLYRVFNPDDFYLMALFSAISIWTLYLGFMYGMKSIKSDSVFSEKYMSSEKIGKLLIYMIVGGYVLQLIQIVISFLGISLGFLGLIETMLPATVGAVALLYWLRGGRKFIYLLLSFIYLAYYFIYFVGGTLFIYSIFLVVAPIIVYIVERRKIPYKVLILVAILLMPIYMTRHAYRNEGLYSKGIIRLSLGMKILKKEYSNIDFKRWKELYETAKINENVDNRMEGVTYLGTIIHSIDIGKSQYAYGKTMIWLPTMILPRFFIPFRPSQNMGDQWAVYYGLKDPAWRASINFPMLCEFYANYGYLGMIIFSFFNGFLIVWFIRKFNDGRGDANLLLLIFVVTKIIVIEANVTLAYGAILQVLAVCWLSKRVLLNK